MGLGGGGFLVWGLRVCGSEAGSGNGGLKSRSQILELRVRAFATHRTWSGSRV